MIIVLMLLITGGTICAIGTGMFVWSLVRDEIEARRAKRERPRDVVDTAEIRRQAVSPELAKVVTATRLAIAQKGNHARLDQTRRHPAVVLATGAGPLRPRPAPAARPVPIIPGPITQQFDAIVTEATGKPPRSRGPREADVHRKWEQPDLFAELAR